MSKKKHTKKSKQLIPEATAHIEQFLESTISSNEMAHDPMTRIIYPDLAALVRHKLNQQMVAKTAGFNNQENWWLNSDTTIRTHTEVEISDKVSNETYHASSQAEPNDETLTSLLNTQRNEVILRAYLFLLGRLPDEAGFSHYQSFLAKRKPLLSIIGDIASSPESKISARKFLGNQFNDYLALKYQSQLLVSIPAKIFCTIRKSHLREIINADNFIDNTFEYVLNRSPDSSGAKHYTNSLKSGKSKLDILLEIYTSEEAINVRPKIVGINWYIWVKKVSEFFPIKVIIDLLKMPSRVHSLILNERSNGVQLNELNSTLFLQNEVIANVIRQMESHKQELGNNLNSISDQLKGELNLLYTNSESKLISLDKAAEQRFQSTLEHHATSVRALDSLAKQFMTELIQLSANSESKLISLDKAAELRFQSTLEYHATSVRSLESLAKQFMTELNQLSSNSESKLISLDIAVEQRFQSTLEHHATTVRALDTAVNHLYKLDSVVENLEVQVRDLLGTIPNIEAGISTKQLTLLGEVSSYFETLRPTLELIHSYSYINARRVAVGCSNGKAVIVKTVPGYVVCSSSDLPLLATLVDSGEIEYGTRLFIEKYLKPNDVFIDVGANVGMHTLAAARAMKNLGRIIAFEAHPETAKLLEQTVLLNGIASMVTIHGHAVSNDTGSVKLFLGKTCGHHSKFNSEGNEQESITIEQTTLDIELANVTGVSLIKIDVEGAELEVLQGATRLINDNPLMGLILEFAPEFILRSGGSIEDWFYILNSNDYIFAAINESDGNLVPTDVDELSRISSINIFFAKPEHPVWRSV